MAVLIRSKEKGPPWWGKGGRSCKLKRKRWFRGEEMSRPLGRRCGGWGDSSPHNDDSWDMQKGTLLAKGHFPPNPRIGLALALPQNLS